MRYTRPRVDGRPASSRFASFGGRCADEVRERCFRIGPLLDADGATAPVVACNMVTAVAIDTLRAAFDIPVIGMEPALGPAAAATRGGQVAMLATHGALHSEHYARLRSDHGRRASVTARNCHRRVAAVDLDSAQLRQQAASAARTGYRGRCIRPAPVRRGLKPVACPSGPASMTYGGVALTRIGVSWPSIACRAVSQWGNAARQVTVATAH